MAGPDPFTQLTITSHNVSLTDTPTEGTFIELYEDGQRTARISYNKETREILIESDQLTNRGDKLYFTLEPATLHVKLTPT